MEETQPLTQETLQAGGGLGSAPPVLGSSLLSSAVNEGVEPYETEVVSNCDLMAFLPDE